MQGMKIEDGTPDIVVQAMLRLNKQLSEPNRPIMSQEEFEALPKVKRIFLTCNVIGCKSVVSTHGLLCVEHDATIR